MNAEFRLVVVLLVNFFFDRAMLSRYMSAAARPPLDNSRNVRHQYDVPFVRERASLARLTHRTQLPAF